MEQKVMDLERAKMNVDYPEFSLIYSWESWDCFTDVDYDALEYLVNHSSRILLPNIKELSNDKRKLINNYKGFILIGLDN
jgi:hypothetical protein